MKHNLYALTHFPTLTFQLRAAGGWIPGAQGSGTKSGTGHSSTAAPPQRSRQFNVPRYLMRARLWDTGGNCGAVRENHSHEYVHLTHSGPHGNWSSPLQWNSIICKPAIDNKYLHNSSYRILTFRPKIKRRLTDNHRPKCSKNQGKLKGIEEKVQ